MSRAWSCGFDSRLSLYPLEGNSSIKNPWGFLPEGVEWVPSGKFYFVWPIVYKMDCWLYNYINN